MRYLAPASGSEGVRRTRATGRDAGHGYVIELLGLPAAGKSALLGELRRVVVDLGRPIDAPRASIGPDVTAARRRWRKLGLVTAETWRRPGPTARIARRIVGTQRDPIEGAARATQWIVTQRLMAAVVGRSGMHVFDEGVLQSLWSIGLRGDVSPVLSALEDHLGWWRRPDLVIAVHCPIDVIASRLVARRSRHSRIERVVSSSARMRELERGQDRFVHLLRWWRDLGGGRVIELRNGSDRSVRELVQPLVTTIAPVPGGSVAPPVVRLA